MKVLFTGFVWLACVVCPVTVMAGAPLPAQQAGYTELTFASNFSLEKVDISISPTTGHDWYLWNFFGKRANAEALIFNKKKRTLTLKGDVTGPNGEIATAAPAENSKRFVGRAFGGGAYIEATIAFDPHDVITQDYKGHPSFWSMAIEHLAQPPDAFAALRKDRFEHFVELDIFEYDLRRYIHAVNVYGGAIHDWYGIWRKTCPKGFCSITNSDVKRWLPEHVNLKQFHRYAALWKTATADRMGYVQFYFDDQPVGGRVSWSQCAKGAVPSAANYTPFCALDSQHLVLILGTGVGEPLTVKEVRVFQASFSHNMSN